MLLPLSFTTGSNFLRLQMLMRKYSVRIRGIFSVFHQYFTAESKIEEENTSNLIPSPSTEEFFLFFLSLAKVTPRVTGVTIFHLCTSVICYRVSTAFACTSALKQNGVFTYPTTPGCTDQHTGALTPHW